MDNAAKQLFKDICDELGIKCTLLSKGWIFMLEKNGITRFFVGYKSGLTDHALGKIIDDKYALYDVLREKGLPVCEYSIVYGEKMNEYYASGYNSIHYVKEYFYQHNQDIVLKPNNGSCGKDVYRIRNVKELEEKYYLLTAKHNSINMSPFYSIKHEYRFIVLDGEVKIAYQKNKPIVYGDGKSSIRDLLITFNDYFIDILKDPFYDRVLNIGEEFEYNWKFNLSQGSTSSEITDSNLYKKLEDIALKASNAIGLRFGSIDIIVTENEECLIIEMNSGVMLYDKTKPLYKEALMKMF